MGLAGARVETIDPNWAELVVRFLTSPLVSPLLLSLGMLGLIFRIKAGHFGIGALASLTSLGLFFGSGVLLGLAGWEEVILLALGFVRLRRRGVRPAGLRGRRRHRPRADRDLDRPGPGGHVRRPVVI